MWFYLIFILYPLVQCALLAAFRKDRFLWTAPVISLGVLALAAFVAFTSTWNVSTMFRGEFTGPFMVILTLAFLWSLICALVFMLVGSLIRLIRRKGVIKKMLIESAVEILLLAASVYGVMALLPMIVHAKP